MPFLADSAAAVFDQCVAETSSHSGKLIQRVIRRAVHDMPRCAALGSDAAQGRRIREAAAALLHAQDRICTLFQRAMARRLRAGGEAPAMAAQSPPGLSLVGDGETLQRLEQSRLEDAACRAAQGELAVLDALVSSAHGHLLVRGGANPLRPRTFALCLHEALDGCGARPEIRARWFAHLGDPLGMELAQLYAALSRRLRARGVREAEFPPPGMPAFTGWGRASAAAISFAAATTAPGT